MDGIMVDRRVHHSLTPYNGHITSSHLPVPLLNGYDDARRHPGLSSSSARSDSTTTSWERHQPRQRISSRDDHSTGSGIYQSGDNRPSLPSLRTVLGDSTRSPPATPHHQLQPLPREPVYDQSTYKPPSLYPNKRTRTDSGWDGQEADRKKADVSMTSLPYVTNRQDDRGMPQQLELPTLSGGSPASYRHTHDGRRASPEDRGRSVHVPTSPRRALTQTFDSSTRHSHQFQTPQHHLSPRDAHMDGTPLHAYDQAGIVHSRSPSISMAEDGAARVFGHPGAQQPFRPEPHRMPSTHSTGYRDEYPNINRLDGPQGYNGASYPYSQAFFVPSHYDYQNGKSRKRSNLPKQSTEIMKRWFDDNLSNPYPSEEQKRHFAAVAGINLTQVSNWFINHRRRCPELREKRDKGRAGSRDESV